MASSEAGLWEWLRDITLPLGHFSRIESPDTASGFPDVHYEILSGDICHSGTIELKHSPSLMMSQVPFPDERRGLHRTQKVWIRNAVRQKATVWVFAEVTPLVYLIPGSYARRGFNGATVEELSDLATGGILSIHEPEYSARTLKELLT